MKIKIFITGIVYGLCMRLIFGAGIWFDKKDSLMASGPMLASFVLLVPLLIGIYTVYAARDSKPGWMFVVAGPWVPTLCFVAGSAVLLIEGSICIAMATPIFCLMASLGGLLGRLLIQFVKPRPASVHAWLLLPLFSAYAEARLPLPQEIEHSVATTWIAAPPERVWSYINHAVAIKPAEMQGGLAYRIGLPYPLEAITRETNQGRVRKLRWDKNVSFDEPITAWEENRFIEWTYAFKPDSFPPGALDEHVLIGGKYFDLVDTSYRLDPEGGGTRLAISVHYRVSTHFNWYAQWWGRILVDDSANAILRFYKNRSET